MRSYMEKKCLDHIQTIAQSSENRLSVDIAYTKNKALIASVRSCTNRGCSILPGFVITGIYDHTVQTEKCTFDEKISLCKIYEKDDAGYILIDSGSFDPNTWDRVFYFEKNNDGFDIREFDAPKETRSLSI